jgi:hypothetical protein
MCDVRKSVVRVVVMGLAVVMLIGTFAPAKAQTNKKPTRVGRRMPPGWRGSSGLPRRRTRIATS